MSIVTCGGERMSVFGSYCTEEYDGNISYFTPPFCITSDRTAVRTMPLYVPLTVTLPLAAVMPATVSKRLLIVADVTPTACCTSYTASSDTSVMPSYMLTVEVTAPLLNFVPE